MPQKFLFLKNDDDDVLLEAFSKLPSYYIEIGVIDEDSKREATESSGKKKITKVGITNAELMFIHEYGSPMNKIKERPVLQMTIDWANKELLDQTIDNAVTAFIKSDFDQKALEKEFLKMCRRMENYARHIIYDNDGRLEANKPSTIKRKGDNHPLFDTGQLAKSITCNLVKID